MKNFPSNQAKELTPGVFSLLQKPIVALLPTILPSPAKETFITLEKE